jgi:hypothetical protein
MRFLKKFNSIYSFVFSFSHRFDKKKTIKGGFDFDLNRFGFGASFEYQSFYKQFFCYFYIGFIEIYFDYYF